MNPYLNFISTLDIYQSQYTETRKNTYKFPPNINSKNECDKFLNLIDENFIQDNQYELSNHYSNEKITLERKDKTLHINNILKLDKKIIKKDIENLSSLIEIIDENPLLSNVEYNIDLARLHNIKNELKELNSMIGMSELKISVLNQIIYYIQDLHKDSKGDYMHTCIYGPPGTGKTEVARIIGKIYSKLGILKKGVFKKVTRPDLIAGYLGQTAMKTKKIVEECLDGVLFIDEAYSLGNKEKRDFFSKECIDTLCELLSEHKDNLMVIIAGYKDELDECFFSYNNGLKSRFTWCFDTSEYTHIELKDIFKKIVLENGWKLGIEEKELESWFLKNKASFTYFGRDMEALFSKVKINHSRRIFCISDSSIKKRINQDDIERGYKDFIKYKNKKMDIENTNYKSMFM